MWSWLSGWFKNTPPPSPVDVEEVLGDAQEVLLRELRSGFATREQALELAIESAEEVPRNALAPSLSAAAEEEIGRLRAERETWNAPTDCDRLEQAFQALEAGGIVARENFTCCQTCGNYEIDDEIKTTRARGIDVRGYTYFHQQDTEAAVDGGGLMLAFGPARKGETAESIGRAVADALTAAGLSVTWSGDAGRRVGVAMEWRRRRNPALD